MKVCIVYLAILVVFIAFIPYVIIQYIMPDSNINIGSEIRLYNTVNEKTEIVSLEDYIVGVVCAEMPAEFSSEALKSQAVAARTYAIKKILSNTKTHSDGDLCTDYSHCQAYIDRNKAKEKWGSNYNKYIKKVETAVILTQGQYLTYNNEPAVTVFHACSNGVTEKSSDVWGGNIPYLTNVDSVGDYSKKDYISYAVFTREDFISILENYLKVKINESNVPVGLVTQSSGNNVTDIELYGNKLKGTEVRALFSLKSTSFTLDYKENEFIFTVCGNGHGVGMSQYGADYMGKNNYSYMEILQHYYPGTQLSVLNK